MECTATEEEARFRKARRRVFEKFLRCSAQLGDLRPAVALKKKGRRATGGMIAALIFGLDDQGRPFRGDFSPKAGPGNAAADDDDFEIHPAGYELESRAV